jgi:hypothetical protein
LLKGLTFVGFFTNFSSTFTCIILVFDKIYMNYFQEVVSTVIHCLQFIFSCHSRLCSNTSLATYFFLPLWNTSLHPHMVISSILESSLFLFSICLSFLTFLPSPLYSKVRREQPTFPTSNFFLLSFQLTSAGFILLSLELFIKIINYLFVA